jgi:hypothetical protein
MLYFFDDKDNQDYISEYLEDLDDDADFFGLPSEDDPYENEFVSDEGYE